MLQNVKSRGCPRKGSCCHQKGRRDHHHNCSGGQNGANAKACNTGDAAPLAAEDTNDIKLEIDGVAIDGSLDAVDSIA